MKKTELGAWGENLAAAQLEKEGYRIRERNFRCRLGEIDIIAQKGDILAFFLTGRPWAQALQPRFDVLEIYAPQGPEGPTRCEHLTDAFE